MNSRGDDYLSDSHGNPILDRFGRPVRRRSAQSSGNQRGAQRPARPSRNSAPPPSVEPTRQLDRPTQYIPPQQSAPQQVPGQVGQVNYQPPVQYAGQPPQVPPQQPPRPPKQRRPRRRFRPGCGCFSLVLITVLTLVVVGTLWADSKLNRIDALPDTKAANTAGTNWLLVGSDSRQGLTADQINTLGTGGDIGAGRTDTIMLLHIPNSGKATLLSIPRDSYVSIPGHGQDKINSAFSIGGPKLLAETVQDATGLRIDHYAEIGFGGFSNMVDAVGGVNMCVKEPINDPLANIDLQEGCQDMSGPTALGYVRTRATAMGDLDRVERQRQFFSTLMDKASSPSTLANPFRLVPLINSTTGSFTVNKSDHVWHLARVAWAMRSGVNTETVPVGGFGDYDVGSVVLWDEPAAEQLFASLR